jgi:FtsZ-binding cell division protein ZapB
MTEKNTQLEAGLASDLNRELEALREERDVFFDAHHNSSLLIKKLEKENERLRGESKNWRTIDSAPNDTPLLLIANGVVQDVTYALCASEKQWYTVQDQEMIDDDDFKPTYWQRLPRAKL